METVFLASFVFGALFTAVALLLGAASHVPGMDVGHFGGHAHLAHPHAGSHAGGSGSTGRVAPGVRLPTFNISSALAFLTWFGAAGYVLLRLAGWPLVLTLPVAVAAGLAGWAVVAWFLAKVLQGEQEMDPSEYRLEGTLARVTVGIPGGNGSGPVGEIVYAKAGSRRSEAARSLDGQPIPRGADVVIVEYTRGVALVEPLPGASESDN